jgi:2-keto-3-deoxy-L-rhamnonate aldolase RhmA
VLKPGGRFLCLEFSKVDVPGVDAVCIGPNDLSGTMGLMRQTGHPDVRAAIDRVYAAAKARGIPACPGVTMPTAELADLAAKGCRMLIATGDLDLLVRGAPAAAAEVRAAVG